MITITKDNGKDLTIPKNDILAVNLNKRFKRHTNEVEEVELRINLKSSQVAYDIPYPTLERAEEERNKILSLIK